MDLTVTLMDFRRDGREVVLERLPGFSTQMNSAALKGESAIYRAVCAGANGFIIRNDVDEEVARWQMGEPPIV